MRDGGEGLREEGAGGGDGVYMYSRPWSVDSPSMPNITVRGVCKQGSEPRRVLRIEDMQIKKIRVKILTAVSLASHMPSINLPIKILNRFKKKLYHQLGVMQRSIIYGAHIWRPKHNRNTSDI